MDKRKQRNWAWKGYGEISGAYWTSVKGNAKKRNLIVDLSIKDAWQIFLTQDRKCALSSLPIFFAQNYRSSEQTASLDRIDSSKGYSKDNVRWVHKIINGMKMKLDDTTFIEFCRYVARTTEANLPILEANRNNGI